jgi:hypothetical protein
MANAVPYTRSSASNVEPVIIALGNMEMASIFCRIVVAVAYKRSFPVIMQIRIRKGNPFRSVAYIHEAIVVVFIVG